jgi:sulfur dioxygenase
MSLIFRQLQDAETSTYTYIVGDENTREVAIIDSVKEQFPEYKKLIQQEKWNVRYLLETHVHADHITANGLLMESFPNAKVAVFSGAKISCPFIPLDEGSRLQVGAVTILTLHTPGHTSDDLSFLVDGNRLLCGDTIIINSCGRTDFQAGSSDLMFESLQRIKNLDDNILIYPGHDYNNRFVTTVAEQQKCNRLMSLTKAELNAELASWNLPPPRKIQESVPANLMCGRDRQPSPH